MPFFERFKWNSVFQCSDDVHVWYQMKAYMCANVKVKHTWKQGLIIITIKIFEKVMYEQLYEYLNNYLNDLLCSFRKTHLTQHIFSRLIRSFKKGPDNSGLVGTILMDLSKAYDCLLYDLPIAKLDAYGLDKPSLNLFNGYFRFWKQTEKIGSAYSDCY